MKQLLIVKGNNGYSTTLADTTDGKIGFFKLSDNTPYNGSAAIAEDFGITLGRGTNSPIFMIPEVDFKTLEVTKSLPIKGTNFAGSYKMPDAVSEGEVYTIVLVKKNTVFNERNTWTVTETATGKSTPVSIAKTLANQLKEQAAAGSLNMTVTYVDDSDTISFQGKDEIDWELKVSNDAVDGTVTVTSPGVKSVGDTKFIKDLASRCAAGKGFDSLYGDGKEIYPGYPEAVATIALNDSGNYVQTGTSSAPESGDMRKFSTAGYVVYSLHFATKRKAGKQLNELVWQYVHIAVPIASGAATAMTKIDTLFGIS